MSGNGAKIEKAVFPSVFGDGLMGLSAREDIAPNKCFIAVPKKLVISVPMARESMSGFFSKYPGLFTDKHPDHEFLILVSFLLHHYLQGEKSFWYPYI